MDIAGVLASGPFSPSWESLRNFAVPAWYQDAKLGIFVHWGIYSVPAFGNEWYARNMYVQGQPEFDHHVATYGPQSQFGYKDFIPSFRGEKFDPVAWASLFKRAGAKYVMPVAEHHDGFAMYDCSFSRWTAARMGPCRDVIGELAHAVRDQGLTFGLSSHRAEHWFYMHGGREFDSDVQDPAYADFYGPAVPLTGGELGRKNAEPFPDQAYLDDWMARTCELVDRYRPQLVYFDWWIMHPAFESSLQRFAAYYYNRGASWGQGVAINYKEDAFPEGTAVFDVERGQPAGIRPQLWQTCTSISNNSWGYVHDQQYKTAEQIVSILIDIVSKNGTLLLNVGPRPDGTIPEAEVEILTEIGDWLAINGEAIYGTRPWRIHGEGPTQAVDGAFTETKQPAYTGQDIRFTTRGDTLYAIVLAWPGDRVTIRSLGAGAWDGRAGRVDLLGCEAALAWRQDPEGLVVTLPDHPPCKHAFALRITLD